MGALEDLRRLTDDASGTPPEDGRDLFRRVRRRRVRRRALGATAGSFATLLLAVAMWPGSGLRADLVIDAVGGADTLSAPAGVGAIADYLADGTPVFVTRTAGGEVYVLDALDPHLDGKLVVYCPGLERLLDPVQDSSYRLDGTYAGGPSPSDLSRYPAEAGADGTGVTVVSETRVESGGRSAEQDDYPETRCERAVAHVPDTSVRDLGIHDVARPDRWGWAYVRFESGASSPRLCHALRGCQVADDAAPTTVELRQLDGMPSWALVREMEDGRIAARFAPRPIDINTGPVTDPVDGARRDLGWGAPAVLRAVTVDGVTRNVEDRGLRLRFDPEGWFSADTPCGTRYGQFGLEDARTVTFGEVRVRERPAADCEADLQRTIEAFFVEGASWSLSLDGGEIVIEAEQGDGLRY